MFACAASCVLLGGDEFLALVGGDEFPHPVGKAHRLVDAVAGDAGDGGAHVSFAVDLEDAFLPDECLGRSQEGGLDVGFGEFCGEACVE